MIKFKDRFNRQNLAIRKYDIRYKEKSFGFRRETLPAFIDSNGDIIWVNSKGSYHSTVGPALSAVAGYLEYYLYGSPVTILEIKMI